MQLLISYHRLLVEGLLLLLFINLILPWILRQNRARMILYTRIGFFAFWALWSMTLFSGLIVWIFASRPVTVPLIVMWIVTLTLPILDGYRAFALRRQWLEEKEGLGINTLLIVIEILSIVATILAKIFL